MDPTSLRQKCRWSRILTATFLASLLTGCFLSDVPAISAETAEDLGPKFEFWIYRDGGDERVKESKFIFLRGSGTEYRAQTTFRDNPPQPYSKGVYIKRLGSRRGLPVYLLQFDFSGFRPEHEITPEAVGAHFVFFPVALDSDGTGIVGLSKCENDNVRDKSHEYGVQLDCSKKSGDFLWEVTNRPEEIRIWDFLQDVLRSELFEWEDSRPEGALKHRL